MPKYVILYRAQASAMEQMENLTPEQAQTGMELWATWAGKVGDRVVDFGAPLAPRTTVGTAGADQAIAGYSILEAGSESEVTALLEDHPHFHTPGDTSIEVLEVLPVPGS
jgi:hypothetical protein